MNLHSFRVHADGTVTWTLRHDNMPNKPKLEDNPERMGSEASARADQPSRPKCWQHSVVRPVERP